MAIKFVAVFNSASTYEQYLKHLRFAHRLLRLDNSWYSQAVIQVKRGAAKGTPSGLKKVALPTREVKAVIKLVVDSDPMLAALMAISRMF